MNRCAPSTAFTSASGSSRQTSPGSRPGGSAATLTSMSNSLLPLVPLLRRALARAVGVVGQHHAAGERLQELDVLLGQRGATGGDRVRHAREREAHDVGVALADHDLVPRADLRLGPVQAVEQPALVVQRRLRGVLVLRPVGGERPAAEADRQIRRGRRSGTSAATGSSPAAGSDRFTNASPAASMSSRENF